MLVASPTRSFSPAAEESAIEWEDAPCPQCGNMLSRPVLEAADNAPAGGGLRFGVVQCLRCDLWYTNPRPGPNSIGRFYPEDYHPHRAPRRPRTKWLPGRDWLSRCLGRPCRERHCLPIVGQGRLLDFGCGNGEFLLRMRDRGWQVTGLDSSAKVIQLLRREHGVSGHIGSLPHSDLAPGSFDAITMWASLEHVHQPLQILREAHRLLAPGGRLYVEVHNVESWGQRLFGPHWFSLDLPRHLTHLAQQHCGESCSAPVFGPKACGSFRTRRRSANRCALPAQRAPPLPVISCSPSSPSACSGRGSRTSPAAAIICSRVPSGRNKSYGTSIALRWDV